MAEAQEEARRHNQLIEPSHLLLAILRSPNSGACRLLQHKVESTNGLDAIVFAVVQRATVEKVVLPKKIPMSRTTKETIEQSIEAVMKRGWRWNSCDILLGILRHGKSAAADALTSAGVTLESLEAVIKSEGLEAFFDDIVGLAHGRDSE